MGERSGTRVDDNFEVGSTSPVPRLLGSGLAGRGRIKYRTPPVRGIIKWTGETLTTIVYYDILQSEAT